jgi:hypothetical protein
MISTTVTQTYHCSAKIAINKAGISIIKIGTVQIPTNR